ncbi:MAG: hypothetical protein WD767_01555 [Alphaproteobacteria bacterium]
MKPFVILIAGMPRSGSTWQYNAARLILNRKYPAIYSGWCADYDPATKEPVHLVKVHTPEQVRFDYSLVLTTKRDLLECIESSKRMGWLTDDNFFIQILMQMHLYNYWHARSAVETDYLTIQNNPEKAILDIANILEITLSIDDAGQISEQINAMSPPDPDDIGPHRYDRVTLLHPKHISNNEPARLTEEQRRFFAEQFSYWK